MYVENVLLRPPDPDPCLWCQQHSFPPQGSPHYLIVGDSGSFPCEPRHTNSGTCQTVMALSCPLAMLVRVPPSPVPCLFLLMAVLYSVEVQS